MEKSKVIKIEIKLQEMLKLRKQLQSKVNLEPAQTGSSYVIRRRKGENDKRISVAKNTNPPHNVNFMRRNDIFSAR